MATQTTKYKILIASPSDVTEERKVISNIIENWNIAHSDHYRATLKPVLWEVDSTPEMGERPQSIINKQLVRECDFLVGAFWTRLGTPTGKAESGTLEEITEFMKAKKPVLLYFSSRPINPDNIDNEEHKRLTEFKKQCEKDGLIVKYKSIEELKDKLQMHISKTINEIHQTPKRTSEDISNIISESYPIIQEHSQTITEEVNGNSLATASSNTKEINPDIITKMTVMPRVYDEKRLPPIGSEKLPFYSWDGQNFEGFWYDLKTGNTSETLEIGEGHGNALTKPIYHNNRIIPESTLEYSTVIQTKTLKLVESGFISNNILNSFPNGQYYILGWQGEPYIALKGDAKKLIKLVLEQGSADKKSLAIGETWDIGDGWTLSAQSIDSKASPRQVWLVLSKDGVKLEDKVVRQGDAFIYRKDIAGKSDAPLFVTYVDSIFAGATTDIVQLKYTWAVSTTVTEIMSGDTFGNMEVTSAGSSEIILMNKDKELTLDEDSTTEIMGDLKFRVADDNNFLRFYPTVRKDLENGN